MLQQYLSRSGPRPRSAAEFTPSNKSQVRDLMALGDGEGVPLSGDNRDTDRDKDRDRQRRRKTESKTQQ